ncbi:hypothetical protein GCM10023148_37730 [Actinokineospora soli]
MLRTVAADGLLADTAAVGKDAAEAAQALDHALVVGVRGGGLLLGIALTRPVSADAAKAAQAHGFLVNNVQPDALRLAPPLVVTDEQAKALVTALPSILGEA